MQWTIVPDKEVPIIAISLMKLQNMTSYLDTLGIGNCLGRKQLTYNEWETSKFPIYCDKGTLCI